MQLPVIVPARNIKHFSSIPTLYSSLPSSQSEIQSQPSHISNLINYNCLKTKTILIFSNTSFESIQVNDQSFSSSGILPCLLVNSKILEGPEILSFLEKENISINSHLSEEDKANCRAFSSLIESTLVFTMVYFKLLI